MGRVRSFESHVISRTTFGWNRQVEREIIDQGWSAWLDAQLDPGAITDAKVDRLLAGYQTLENSNWQNYVFADSTEDGWERLRMERAHATLLRAVYSRRQLHEVMVEFWTNHFCINLDESPADHMVTADNRTVARAHALGRFADLLSASAHSPAMLIYLDNFVSNANSGDGVNENYARELLELHSMGIVEGVQQYNEADMRGVARIMSGWSVNTNDGQHVFQYRSGYHWGGPVSILGGTFSTPGRTGTAGRQDGEALLEFLAHHDATAHHLAYKLCRRFVADDPPPGLVESAAAVYLDNDTAIAPVLRHILRSPEFAASVGAKVRRGFEVYTAYARALGGTIDADPLSDVSRYTHGYGWGLLDRLGQRLWGHVTPDGYPDTGPDWISADGLLRRWDMAGTATATWLEGWSFDAASLLQPQGPTVDSWLERVARRVLGTVTGYRTHGYGDVPTKAEDAVRWAKAKNVVTGVSGGRYRPGATITRGELVGMLWRTAGRPTGHPRHGCTDVPAALDGAVRWAKATGVMAPFPNRTFRPNAGVTRSLFATATWAQAGRPTGWGGHDCTDVPAGIENAVRWTVGCGWLLPVAEHTFRPAGALSRADATIALFHLHDTTATLLTPAERAACLALFTDVPRTGGQTVPQWLVDWKGHDLLTLLLSLPRSQHR